MTNQIEPVNSFAPIRNMALLFNQTKFLIERDPRLPGFGVFYGPSGFGKTHASIYTTHKTHAARVEIGDSWSKKKLLENISLELGMGKPRGTIADLAEKIIEKLSDNPSQPLIIDEADKLVEKKMLEIVREIQEASQAPIILMGEEKLPAKLATNERLHNRVLSWQAAEACDLDDTKKLAKSYCPNVTLHDDLIERICKQTHGRARRITTTLVNILEFAQRNGLTAIASADYDGRIISGETPRPRSLPQ